MLSAQYAASVGEILARRFSRVLPPPEQGSQPVLLTLVPASEFEHEGAFRTQVYPNGQVQVSLAWGEGTSREMLERALAQGHLTYLSGAYASGSVRVPLWLELAGQHLARAQAVPAHGHYLRGRVAEGTPMRLERILLATRSEKLDDDLGPHSYWLLKFLESEGRGPGQLQNFLIRLFRGEAPLAAMNAVYGDDLRSTSEAQLWWMVGVNELVRTPGSPMVSAGESRRRVKKLSRLVFELDGEEVRLFPEDLWEHRASGRLQDELQHRVQVTQLEMPSIHPYYHNVILSLERVFAAVLAANQEDYGEAIAAFRHDLRSGDELAAETASILDDLAAELER